ETRLHAQGPARFSRLDEPLAQIFFADDLRHPFAQVCQLFINGHRGKSLVLLYLRKMCCPYFLPLEARTVAEDVRNSMLPLGGFWTGVCEASCDDSGPLDDATLIRLCNLGYARGQCPRFPADGGPDAVR